MTVSPTITDEPMPQPDEVAIVRAGLTAYNRQHASDDAYHPITLFVRDAHGTVVGGLLGGPIWHWLYVEILWLSDELRGQGYGSRLPAGSGTAGHRARVHWVSSGYDELPSPGFL